MDYRALENARNGARLSFGTCLNHISLHRRHPIHDEDVQIPARFKIGLAHFKARRDDFPHPVHAKADQRCHIALVRDQPEILNRPLPVRPRFQHIEEPLFGISNAFGIGLAPRGLDPVKTGQKIRVGELNVAIVRASAIRAGRCATSSAPIAASLIGKSRG